MARMLAVWAGLLCLCGQAAAATYTVTSWSQRFSPSSFPVTFKKTLGTSDLIATGAGTYFSFVAPASGTFTVSLTATKSFGATYDISSTIRDLSANVLARVYNGSSTTVSLSKGVTYGISLTSVNSSWASNAASYEYSITIGGSSGGSSGGNTTTKPDLSFYTPSGWASSLVLNTSSSSQSSSSSSFKDTDDIYLSWAIQCTDASISSTFYTYLYIDGTKTKSWSTSGLSKGYYTSVKNANLGKLSAGTHTIKLVTDATGAVSESNGSNNTVSRTITVSSSNNDSCYTDIKIRFYSGGGSGSMSTLTRTVNLCSESSSYTLPSCSFTRSGYDFAGWSVEDACSVGPASVRQPGYTIYGLCGDLSLTATWKQKQAASYTVYFDANGGTIPGYGSSRSVTVTYGTRNYYSTSGATRSGYRFLGWYTSSSGGSQVYDSSGRAVAGTYWNSYNQWQYNGSVWLYAHWEKTASTYSVYFDANGGSIPGYGSSRSVTVTYGTRNYYSTSGATRSGYRFLGWYDSLYGGEQVYDSSGRAVAGSTYWNYSSQWRYSGSAWLYAHWEAIASTYTVYFDANGGSIPGYGASRSVTVTYGTRNYYSTSGATRSGYRFLGWYTSYYGGEQVYDSSGRAVAGGTYWNYSSQWQYSGSVWLYAQWEEIGGSFTVYFDATDGTIPGYGSYRSITVKSGTRNYYSTSGATRTGYHFLGWYDLPTGGEKVYDSSGRAVPGCTYWNYSSQWRYNGSAWLYAHWAPCNYMVYFEALEGTIPGYGPNRTITVTYGTRNYYSTSGATRPGYRFLGWYDSHTGGEQVYDSSGRAVAGCTYWNYSSQWQYPGEVVLFARFEPIE